MLDTLEKLVLCQQEHAAKDARIAELEQRLDKYSGWAPDQFLRYQEEHRKLQQRHAETDSRRYAAEKALAELQAQVAELESYKGNAAHAANLDHEYFEELRERAEAAEKALAEQAARVKELEASFAYARGRQRSWRESALTLESRLAELVRVAEQAKWLFDIVRDLDQLGHPDDSTCTWRIKAGDLRALAAAVRNARGGTPVICGACFGDGDAQHTCGGGQ